MLSPKELVADLSKDYSKWFQTVLRNNNLDSDENNRVISTLYHVIFSKETTDILVLSSFVDSLETEKFDSIDELVAHICQTLPDYWGIPPIEEGPHMPKVSALKKETLVSGKIISDAWKFIHETGGGLGSSAPNKLVQQLEDYATEHGLVQSDPFPKNALFTSYEEFSTCVTEFVNGKNRREHQKKLLKLDYGILVDVFQIKKVKSKVKKAKTLTGDPAEVFLKMFLTIIEMFHERAKSYPTEIKVKVQHVSLSGCNSDKDSKEKDAKYAIVCQYLGGLLRFFDEAALQLDTTPISFSYENNGGVDPFTFATYTPDPNFLTGKTKWGEPCRIDFVLYASNDKQHLKEEFRWVFSPYSDWLNAFFLVSTLFHSNTSHYQLPSLLTSQSLPDYLGCESVDEFYAKLLHLDFQNHQIEHSNIIKDYFKETPIHGHFLLLQEAYEVFLQALVTQGFFYCCSENIVAKVVSAYSDLMTTVTQYESFNAVQKEKLPLILNSYLILGSSDFLETYQANQALLPPYHPTMLEKIHAKFLFLRDGFAQYLQSGALITLQKGEALLKDWMALSSITQGLDFVLEKDFALLQCQNMWEYYGVYATKEGDPHYISTPTSECAIVMDDETSETIVKPTPMSSIVLRNIKNYQETFPSRIDGLTISFVAPSDMQHIVAAIHKIAKEWNDQKISATINLKIISINNKRNSATYLRRWLDSYFSDHHLVHVNTFLHNLSVTEQEDLENLETLLEDDDLCFVYQVLQGKKLQFEPTSQEDFDVHQAKFPMTFTPDAVASTTGKTRKFCISQFQFKATQEHTQACERVAFPNNIPGKYLTYQTLTLEKIEQSIIESTHKACRWVVCIDKAVDRELLEDESNTKNSKIVGFTTGEGSYGEVNVTVSARKEILSEIKIMLRSRIREKFRNWDDHLLNQAATYCVDELTTFMDGGRILKALNPYDYEVHSYLAYTLMVEKLALTKKDPQFAMRRLVSLDSYQHWFQEPDRRNGGNMQPDFMLLEIPLTADNMDESKPLYLDFKIIECKMGYQNDNHEEKAKHQLEKGLSDLISHWDGDKNDMKHRYWLNQLYRAIIFSPLEFQDSQAEYALLRKKIQGVMLGHYKINWSGALYAFWLDSSDDFWTEGEMKSYVPESFRLQGKSVEDFKIHHCGQLEIQKMLLPPTTRSQVFQYQDLSLPVDVVAEDLSEDELTLEKIVNSNDPMDDPLAVEAPTELPVKIPVGVAVESPVGKSVEYSLPDTVDSLMDGATATEPAKTTGEKILVEPVPLPPKKPLEEVRFLLGEDPRSHEKFYWEFGHKKLNNRHLLINGNSGCGKTYCIQTLLMEATLQGISSVVFDYTGGFANSKLENTFKETLSGRIVQRVVRQSGVPVNPFKKGEIQLDDSFFVDETPVDIASKISEIFASVYKLGDQQKGAVYSAVTAGVPIYGEKMSFPVMRRLLEEQDTTYGKTVLSKIQAFIDINPFAVDEAFDWADIRDSEGMVYVVQLAGYTREVQVLLTELLLWDIWNFSVKTGKESKPFILVMDEAQNINHGEKSPSGKFLTEGRKFGISGWYATQFMKPQLSDDEIQRLQQAGQKLYFCPPDDGVMTVAKNIDIASQGSKDWAERLKKLKKGECVTCGNMLHQESLDKYPPRVIQVTSLEDRT